MTIKTLFLANGYQSRQRTLKGSGFEGRNEGRKIEPGSTPMHSTVEPGTYLAIHLSVHR